MNLPIRSLCIDFNWDDLFRPASPGLYAHADPLTHAEWYLSRGVNVIQSFCVTYNGFAWYRGSEVAPVTPGLRHDFLPELTELGHRGGAKVMGYFCVAANPWWAKCHPGQHHADLPVAQNQPLTLQYLDYLARVIRDVLVNAMVSRGRSGRERRKKIPQAPHGAGLAG